MSKRAQWTIAKDNFLIQYYHSMTSADLAQTLDASRQSVLRRARHLGIPKKTDDQCKHKRYTAAEKAFILDNVNKLGPVAVGDALNRSEESIRIFCKRRKINIIFHPTWTRRNTQYLKKHAMLISVHDIAKHLGKTAEAVRKYASQHGVALKTLGKEDRPIKRANRWSEADKAFLRKNKSTMLHHEIAKHLERTPAAVTKFASENGFLKR